MTSRPTPTTRQPRPTRRGPGRPRGSTTSTGEALGSIRADELLPLAEFRKRMGIGTKGLRSLREAGLPIRRFGRQGFIVGRDCVEWFAALPIDKGDSDNGNT
jgi:hypothetical protein